jgi:hypothetical protein
MTGRWLSAADIVVRIEKQMQFGEKIDYAVIAVPHQAGLLGLPVRVSLSRDAIVRMIEGGAVVPIGSEHLSHAAPRLSFGASVEGEDLLFFGIPKCAGRRHHPIVRAIELNVKTVWRAGSAGSGYPQDNLRPAKISREKINGCNSPMGVGNSDSKRRVLEVSLECSLVGSIHQPWGVTSFTMSKQMRQSGAFTSSPKCSFGLGCSGPPHILRT